MNRIFLCDFFFPVGNTLEFGKNKMTEGRNELGIIAYVFYLYLPDHAD